MPFRPSRALVAASLAFVTGTALAAGPFNGRVLLVAVNGLDSPACGVPPNPCRSITQAIANAVDGDNILVRPGRYGDIDHDGVLSQPGEEHGSFGAISITKRVRIVSTEGASATVIDVSNAAQAVVDVSANGAQFGEKGAGFTLTGGWLQGIVTNPVTNAVIAGNVVRAIPNTGQLIAASAITVTSAGVVEVRDNVLVDNPGAGMIIGGTTDAAFVSVHDNVITGSNAAEGSVGVLVAGFSPHLVFRNTITDNTMGLLVNYGTARIFENLLSGNVFNARVEGVPATVPARGPSFTRNTITASANGGLFVGNGIPGPLTIRENNFYGDATDCGVANFSTGTLDARNNYWGAPTGPSNVDPADNACPRNGPITTAPFSTREFR